MRVGLATIRGATLAPAAPIILRIAPAAEPCLTDAVLKPRLETYGSSAHPDQKAFVRRAIDTRRLSREEDAVREALSLWEERERRRLEMLLAIDKPKRPSRAARNAE